MNHNYKQTDFDYELDDEEAELLEAYDNGEFKAVPDFEQRKKELQVQALAFNQMKKQR